MNKKEQKEYVILEALRYLLNYTRHTNEEDYIQKKLILNRIDAILFLETRKGSSKTNLTKSKENINKEIKKALEFRCSCGYKFTRSPYYDNWICPNCKQGYICNYSESKEESK